MLSELVAPEGAEMASFADVSWFAREHGLVVVTVAELTAVPTPIS